MSGFDSARIEAAVKELLAAWGDNPKRSELQATPARVAKASVELLSGYEVDPAAALAGILPDKYHDILVVKNLKFASFCEHHLLPFFGTVNIVLEPNKTGDIVGFSSFAKLVQGFAKRLQIQERLTEQITATIVEKLVPTGLLVQVKAQHLCVSLRDLAQDEMEFTTVAVRGNFATSSTAKHDALLMLQD